MKELGSWEGTFQAWFFRWLESRLSATLALSKGSRRFGYACEDENLLSFFVFAFVAFFFSTVALRVVRTSMGSAGVKAALYTRSLGGWDLCPQGQRDNCFVFFSLFLCCYLNADRLL